MHAGLPFHPLAELFPLMEGEDYAALVADIRAHGLREPAVVYENQLLDGRNRQRACLETGEVLRTRPLTGDDPLEFVLSANLHRRHLNESQRAMVAAKLANMPAHRPVAAVKSANLPASPQVSQPEAAKRLNVSERSVRHAAVVHAKAEPEVITAVERGKLRVSVAASVAVQPREKQLGRLAREERKASGTHRQTDDFYRTPAATVEALLAVEEFPARIWEPACGDGAISKVLLDAGYDVISTDLIDRGFGEGGVDFLKQTAKRCGCIITNPPFKDDDAFALQAIALKVRKFALLCRLTWLEGGERYRKLFSYGMLARVWVFCDRQTLWFGDDAFPETDGGMTAYAWFVFETDRDRKAPVALGWLHG
jgi:ParB-like chromosome segregation protein Spo0J